MDGIPRPLVSKKLKNSRQGKPAVQATICRLRVSHVTVTIIEIFRRGEKGEFFVALSWLDLGETAG